MPKIIKEITMINPQGLHARPAAMFVQIASKFSSNVTIHKGNDKINGKSIMGLLTLGLQKGTAIKLEIDGSDAEEACQEIVTLLSRQDL